MQPDWGHSNNTRWAGQIEIRATEIIQQPEVTGGYRL